MTRTCKQILTNKKEGKTDKLRKLYSCQTLPDKHAPRTDSETEKSEQFKNIECR